MMHYYEAPMNIAVALVAVDDWLTTKQPIAFRKKAWRVVDEQHFVVTFEQTFPEQRLLQYQVIPEQCADCWRVVEVHYERMRA